MLQILKNLNIDLNRLLESIYEDLDQYKLRSTVGLHSSRRMQANLREPNTGNWFNINYTRYKGLPQGTFSLNSDQMNISVKVSKDSDLENLILKIFTNLK